MPNVYIEDAVFEQYVIEHGYAGAKKKIQELARDGLESEE